MKKLIYTLIICISVFSIKYAIAADCSTSTGEDVIQEVNEIKTDVPKHLIGATICIKQSDGRESCVPAEKFKVVPRIQQFVVTKTKQNSKTVCTPEKNRVSVLAGNGPQEGLDRSNNGKKVVVESRTGAVGGLQYQRLITDDVSVGIQGQTNESILLNIGLDF